MIRVRSTDVWFNAPGIQAAYCPVAAPDSLAARQNVANDMRMAGRHTAASASLPTHDPRTGWTFDGASTYFDARCNLAGNDYITMMAAIVGTGIVCGVGGGSGGNRAYFTPNATTNISWRVNATTNVAPVFPGGVLALTTTDAGGIGYRNGVSEGAVGSVFLGGNSASVLVGSTVGLFGYFGGVMRAWAFCSITLTPAHVTQYSRQMAYCHVNPDWNAWGRRRRYYYAPSAAVAAGNVGIYGKRGAVALPGGVRIEAVQ